MNSKYNIFFCVFICVTLLIPVSSSILKEALEEHLKDISHDEDTESIKHDKQKGEKIHHIESQINDNHKNQFSKANDESKYLKKEHDSKTTSDSDAYKGYNSKQDKAEDNQSSGYKRGHKKGHHNQGFQNSYHKDESSNKSTFFDDFNDEGDQAAYNSRLNSHDNHGGRSYQGSHNNGQEYVRDNYRGGGYNRNGDTGVQRNDYRDYAKKYYLDNAQNYNKYRNGHNNYDRDNIRDYHEYRAPHATHNPGWDWHRWEDRRRWERPSWGNNKGWERDYGGPGYYDDHGIRREGGYGYGPNHGYGYNYGYDESRASPVAEIPHSAPVVAHRKQTITIYEDPRYDGKYKGQLRREEGDHLQLEFKPSNHRYARYDRDDTYYNAPTKEGAVQASKINRLVYNYRQQ